MEIQTYQIHNVLRTYGHLEKLKSSHGDGEIKKTEKLLSGPITLSNESLAHLNTQEDLGEEGGL